MRFFDKMPVRKLIMPVVLAGFIFLLAAFVCSVVLFNMIPGGSGGARALCVAALIISAVGAAATAVFGVIARSGVLKRLNGIADYVENTAERRLTAFPDDEFGRAARALAAAEEETLRFYGEMEKTAKTAVNGGYEPVNTKGLTGGAKKAANDLNAAIKNFSDNAEKSRGLLREADLKTETLRNENNRLTESLNAAADESRTVAEETARVLDGMANGNFTLKTSFDFPERYALLQASLNSAASIYSDFIGGITAFLTKIADDADGKNESAVKAAYPGDFSKVSDAAAAVKRKYSELARQLKDAVDNYESSEKRNAGFNETFRRGVGEITALTLEIESANALSAGYANEAGGLALSAKKDAESGSSGMARTLEAMRDIEKSSNNIHEIIKIIEDIAFQTDLLALNAAVEAAHAGIHGKGFTVVADNVRALAVKSQDAAKQTTDMISIAIENVRNGTKSANQTAETLEKLVGEINGISEIAGKMSAASEAQAETVGKVKNGLEKIIGANGRGIFLEPNGDIKKPAIKPVIRPAIELKQPPIERDTADNKPLPASYKASASAGTFPVKQEHVRGAVINNIKKDIKSENKPEIVRNSVKPAAGDKYEKVYDRKDFGKY